MPQRAEDANAGFSAVGVGVDWLPQDGWRHLAKYGAFDEVVVGRNWSGFGARQFVKEEVAGVAATPQIMLLERRKRGGAESGDDSWENVLLARKLGVTGIRNWLDRGAPVPIGP